MAPSLDRTRGARTHSPTARRPSWCTSMGSVRVPVSDGPKASMTVATIRRDSHRLHAHSGGRTALIGRNVVMLTRAAERDRSDPRVGTDSVMRSSQHKMVTLVNGNVVGTWMPALREGSEKQVMRCNGQQNAIAYYSAEPRTI